MVMLEPHEYRFMNKARKGCSFSREEKDLAYDLACRRMVRLGYQDGNGFSETASLTELGDFIFREERRSRNPVVNILYEIFGPLFTRVA